MTEPDFDVAVVGAGLVGAACAAEFAAAGFSVAIVERDRVGGGTTAAGMGHVVVLDGSEAQFALTRFSQRLWHSYAPQFPPGTDFIECGTIWIAEDEETLREGERKQRSFASRDVAVEWLDPDALARAEPNLRSGLAGGLWVREDAVTDPPKVAQYLVDQATGRGARLILGQSVTRIDSGSVALADGKSLRATHIVNAAGVGAARLTPETPVFPRKGQLFEVAPPSPLVRHQLTELGYTRSARSSAELSVAFSVQPRSDGRSIIGASRQTGADRPEVEPAVIDALRTRATSFLPSLERLPAVRAWTGFRPATRDHLPLIGPCPGLERVWLATGHEGLGITTSLGTARILLDQLLDRPSAIPIDPYFPSRRINPTG